MSAGTSRKTNKIDEVFSVIKGKRKKNLIVYITAGYPDIRSTEKLVLEIDRAGADIIELGVPFSDPVADGPTIQESSQHALAAHVTLAGVFKLASRVRTKISAALVLMGYYNTILQYGLNKFAEDCAKNGIDGVIVPDLIPEEGGKLLKASGAQGIKVIFFLAPTSDDSRIRLVSKLSQGFIYCVTVAGITGARSALPDLNKYVNRIRRFTDKPLALGFGISTPGMLAKVLKHADAAIVGSAVIKVIKANIKKQNLPGIVGAFISRLRRGVPGERKTEKNGYHAQKN